MPHVARIVGVAFYSHNLFVFNVNQDPTEVLAKIAGGPDDPMLGSCLDLKTPRPRWRIKSQIIISQVDVRMI